MPLRTLFLKSTPPDTNSSIEMTRVHRTVVLVVQLISNVDIMVISETDISFPKSLLSHSVVLSTSLRQRSAIANPQLDSGCRERVSCLYAVLSTFVLSVVLRFRGLPTLEIELVEILKQVISVACSADVFGALACEFISSRTEGCLDVLF